MYSMLRFVTRKEFQGSLYWKGCGGGGGGDWVLDAQRKAVASICPAELKIKLEFQLDLQTSSSPIVLALDKSAIKPFSYFVSNENFLTRQENLVVPDDYTAVIV